MQKPPETFFKTDDFLPELRDILSHPPFDPRRIILAAIPVKNSSENRGLVPASLDRFPVSLTSGKDYWIWEVDSLRSLFCGDRQPPILGDYPETYNECFTLFDRHVLEISKFFGDRRDAEMKEIYSTLRRRPDGRSLGFVHDYMWQAAALVLGTRPLSQAEFAAVMARLERSCRTLKKSGRRHVAPCIHHSVNIILYFP